MDYLVDPFFRSEIAGDLEQRNSLDCFCRLRLPDDFECNSADFHVHSEAKHHQPNTGSPRY